MEHTARTTNRIIRLPDVIAQTGLSRSTIYAWIKEGRFPGHISLGNRMVGWRESDVSHWIESRTAVRECTRLQKRT